MARYPGTMAKGILDLLGLAAALALAAPVALLGADYLLAGRPLGAVFLGVAAAMVLAEEYLVRPTDLPGKLAGSVVGRVVDGSGEEDG